MENNVSENKTAFISVTLNIQKAHKDILKSSVKN